MFRQFLTLFHPPKPRGRKQVAGFFTPEMSFAMHMLARRKGRSLQVLMAETFNDVPRKHSDTPVWGVASSGLTRSHEGCYYRLLDKPMQDEARDDRRSN